MFKIENYIAPLILSKVEKFVKNIDQQEFQVSLWQGDVMFQNLELKLDVLEEELQLPVSFLSGHINDLKIQIPWTKIASEPIIITINTIELVVKLKDFSSSPTFQKPKLKKKISVDEDAQAGYMASLIAKILNNISLICNNIVLKFIEEDIVISMNIQHLSIYSADHRWKRAFADVSPTNVLFRKLINIIDFTICLDKRNSSGKIEFVQEPILYKCSMELRFYRKFNAVTSSKLSLTRIDVQINALNLSISSQQLPMLLRLYDLIMALKSGKLQEKYSENQQTQPSYENEQGDNDSWLLWAWNMIPAILPDEQSNEPLETTDKKIFEFGIYVDDLNMMLKAQEFLSDPIIPSNRKAIFKPLLSIHMQEFYVTAISNGVQNFNVKSGIGFVEVLALEECTCGAYVTDPELITAGCRDKSGNYLKDSFMDKTAATMQTKYENMWTNYYEKNTEEDLLSKTPALAVDILHSVELPDDSRSSDIDSDLEFSNFSELYLIRVFGNGFFVNAGAELMHRVGRLVQLYNDCDFLPYIEADKPLQKSQLSPATADDYDALINEVPLRIVQLKLRNSLILVKEWDHEKPSKPLRKLVKHPSVGAVQKHAVKLEIKIDDASMEIKMPLYRNRLVSTACQLPENIENELFDKCFFELSALLKNVKIDMVFDSERRVCEFLCVSGRMKKIIYPHLWTDQNIKENIYEASVDGLSIMINPAQLYALTSIIGSIVKKSTENELEKEVLRNLEKSEMVVLQLTMQKIRTTISETSKCFFAKFSMSDLLGISWKSGTRSFVVNWPDISLQTNLKLNTKKIRLIEELLVLQMQLPKDVENQKLIPVVTLNIAEGSINIDPLVREFLSFKLIFNQVKTERLSRTLSTSTKPAFEPSSNNQIPSIHTSSEGDVTICPQNPEKEAEKEKRSLVDWVEQLYRSVIINVEIKSLTFYHTSALIESFKSSDSLQFLLSQSESHMLALKTPKLVFHSVKNKSMLETISSHFNADLPSSLWGNEKAFTWNLILGNSTAYSMYKKKIYSLIEDLSLNVSIADETAANQTMEKIITGNLLIETLPVTVSIHTSQVKLISSAIDELVGFSLFSNYKKTESTKVRAEKSLAVIHESPQNSSEIKEFLGIATGSTTTKTSHADDKSKKQKSKFSIYVQWVCSKISLILLCDEVAIEKKFILEVDEILFSLHQQDFYQLKSKIASISGTLFERKAGREKWMKNITLGVNVQSDENTSDNANRFLDLTITKAETINVYSRWNLGHKKNRLYNNDITEINLVLQSLDIIVNLDELVEFMPIFGEVRGRREDSENVETAVPRAGSDLPLIHVKCSGFRIFLPCLNENRNSPDVWIVKVNKLIVTPTAINNLIRNQILRPDIHSKACALGILDLAGSKIEDRQYQLTVQGVSLNSSSWEGIAALINEKTVFDSFENPAFEWNNLENGPKLPNFKLNTVFKDSTFSVIYAPCIKFKQTLIAGTAMEFNFVNDLNVEMDMKEIALFINIVERIGNILKVLQPKIENERKTSIIKKETKVNEMSEPFPIFEKRKMFEKKSVDDSGVESISCSNRFQENKLWKKKTSTGVGGWDDATNVPFEFTFTSSKFKLKCSSDGGENDILAVFDTPNVFITQDKYEKCSIFSLHDLLIMFGTEKIFSTRDGLADSSGIKPSLIRIKLTEKSTKNTDCDIVFKRPVSLEFSHMKMIKIFQLKETLEKNSILKISRKTQDVQVDRKTRKFDAMKLHFHKLRNLTAHVACQVVMNFKAQEYNFRLAVSELKGKFKVFDRPEKIEINCDVVNLLVLNRGKMVLHPWTIQAKLKVAQEYWKKDPMVQMNVNSNFLRFDFGWDLLKDVQVCSEMFRDVLKRQSEKVVNEEIRPKYPPNLIKLPVQSFTNKVHSTIEHFQDDLRSGAFQFLETSSTRDLPLPYQIQIIDNDDGVICWRYPMPRALQKIKIFPVPFQAANQITVVCKIEFYSQLKSKFEEFCDFTLAENETKLLDLKQNRPSAEIWRIKIPKVFLKRDSDDEDEGGDYEFQMHPKVLVACLRIDSYYVSSAIPNVAMFVEFSHIELNVMNKMASSDKMPSIVENFKLIDDTKEHEAVKVSVKALKVYGQFFDEGYENFEIDGNIGAEVIDYGCGNLLPIIDDFRFKTLVNFNQSDVNINLITEKIQLKYSPAIGHSLLVTTKTWEQHINGSNQMLFHTKFIVCNNTSSPVGISQFQTTEMICLMPQSFVLYHFRTDKLEQKLQLCVCTKGLWSLKTEAIQIQNEGVEYIKLDENQYFIVTVKNVTNFQRKVTIEGSVALFNMTKEFFRVQYKRYDKDIDAPDKCETFEFDIDAHRSSSVFGTCLAESQQSIRLRMIKNFSGEIPLREIVVNNKPWLVKVPSTSKCGFTSFWVRIIRQTSYDNISRVLVMIWPMFVAKSILPVNTTVFEESQSESYVILGRGEKLEMEMNGTHEDEHELLLKGNYAMLDDEDAKVKLSYKLINRNSFFKIPDELSDVNRAVEMLETKIDEKWPCAKDEEFRSHRDVTLNGPILPVYHLSSQSPEELSCSLMLTLAPWCLIINSSGSLVKITNLTSNEICSVEANNVMMPVYINNSFTLSVQIDSDWFDSAPIYINNSKKKIPNSHAFPLEGQISVNIQKESEILQLVLTSSIENKMRLIIVSSLVVAVNYSKHDFRIFSFVADVGEKLEGVKRNETHSKKFKMILGDRNGSSEQGLPIPLFADLCASKGKRKVNTNFSSLISIGSSTDEASCPIRIQSTMRKCINIPSDNKNIPISISVIKYNEQFFISIHDDCSPFMSVENNTDFNLYVAQTDLANPSTKYILPHKEVSDERFGWFQTVPSKQRVFYTPPTINEHFPDIFNHDYGLIFACVTGDDFARWSQPIKIDSTKKIIISVPLFGSIRVIVDVREKTLKVSIGYIQKDEPTSKSEPSRDFYRGLAQPLFLDVNTNYQKTFSMTRKSTAKALNINAFFERLSCTIFKDGERKRVEQISLIFDDIGVKYSKLECKLKINFAKIQIDNELYDTGDYDFPVVLCNKEIPKILSEEVSGTSVWGLSDILELQQTHNTFSVDVDLFEINEIENVVIELQPIRLYIEDTFINILLETVDDCLPTNLKTKVEDTKRVKLSDGMVLVPSVVMIQSLHLSNPLRLRCIRLEPLHILLSVHTCMRMYIALDHSPLDFSAYEKLNVYTLPMKLGNSIGLHYLSSAIFGAGWVVGSLEILGSPSGLARSVTTGFKDFVSMPAQGLLQGPWEFLVGLTYGSVSLVRNVTTGTVNSVTKLATSVARNIDRLTLDNEHIHLKTDASRRHRPQGLTEGLQQGLTGFGISILGAIGGLAHHPLQAKNTVEVFTGVGKGIVGVFAKPISGAAEFFALTGSGMLQSVGYNLLPLPRTHNIENHLMRPTAEKLMKQLPQYASTNLTLFSCRATFSRKNDIKNSFVVLMSHVMVIADLERDMVIDVIPLERIQPISRTGGADNLFVFKIKEEEESPTNHEQKYSVSNRTVQYIKQLSGQHHLTAGRSSDENSEEENGAKADFDEVESLSAVGTDKKISFYLDEVTGKYLVSYINLIKSHMASKDDVFPLFDK